MKKVTSLLMASMFIMMVLLQTVKAAEICFCDNCGAELTTYANEVRHWTDEHKVYLNEYVDGKPVYSICTITYVETRVCKVCPNGHGIKETKYITDSFHSITTPH